MVTRFWSKGGERVVNRRGLLRDAQEPQSGQREREGCVRWGLPSEANGQEEK